MSQTDESETNNKINDSNRKQNRKVTNIPILLTYSQKPIKLIRMLQFRHIPIRHVWPITLYK